jgi:hypothetical protein
VIVPLLLFAQLGTIQFHASTSPDTVYVGQQVSYDASTLVDDIARRVLRANPSYTPSEVQGATVYDFPFDTAAIFDVTIAGTHFRRYVYHRAFFPLTAGVYTIPPSTLRYELPDDEGYGSTLRAYTLESEGSTVVAIPLPAAGRPLDFDGAVGEFVDTAFTDGATPRMGDTFVFTVRVSGVGNINMLSRPALAIPWADITASEERVVWDSVGTAVRGSKEFDWIVTPKFVGEMIVPPVRFVYFDPSSRQYSVATTVPIKLEVGEGRDAAPAKGRRVDPIGDSPFPILMASVRQNPLLYAGVGVAILGVIVAVVVWLTRRRSDDDDEE